MKTFIVQTVVAAFILTSSASMRAADDPKSELERRLAELRGKGEPVTIDDLKPRGVEPKDNARDQIEAAAKAIKDSPEYDAIDNRDENVRLPLTPFEEEKLGIIHEQNRPALDQLAEAVKKPQAIADVEWKSPGVTVILPGLNGIRACANLLRYESFNQAGLGNWQAALDRAFANDILVRYADSHQVLVGALVATGIRALEAKLVIDLAPAIEIGDKSPAISRDALSKRIAELYDQTALQNSYVRGFQAERVATTDTIQSLIDGRLAPEDLQKMMGGNGKIPDVQSTELMQVNQVHLLDYYAESIAIARDAPDHPAAAEGFSNSKTAKAIQTNKREPQWAMAAVLAPGLNRSLMSKFMVMTYREAAAAGLAIRLYRVDHNDQYPAKLDDLVPTYLPRLPRDYMASNKPLNYRTGAQPLLWSVGRDGVDHDGQPAVRGKADTGDEVFPIRLTPRDVAAQ